MEDILFIRLRLLGDIIFTIPAVQIYRRHFPDSRIYYLVEEKFREAAALVPGIDQVLTVPFKMGLKDIFRFRREIRGLGIDTVVDFHSGPKAALLTRLTGAKIRIGYHTPNRNWAYNRLIPRKIGPGFTHSVFNQARLLTLLGIPIKAEEIPVYPEIPIDETRVAENVKEAVDGRKKIVLHIGAGNRFRDWGTENFFSLIEKLNQCPDCKVEVLLIGNTEAERQRGNYLQERLRVRDLTGRLSILETLYVISKAAVYFGVDSGALHLASLTATPIVALYGPNIPAVSGPWRQSQVTLLQQDLACRPCSQRGCQYDTMMCMKNITVDETYEAIIRYLQ